jgi:MFS family permease
MSDNLSARPARDYSAYIVAFLTNAALVTTSIFIPLIALDFTRNRFVVGLIVASYNGAIFLSSAFFGRLADLKGKKRVLNIGLALCGLSFLLHLLIRDLPSLFVVRVLTGLTAGMYPAALTSLVFESNFLFGVFTAAGSLGWGAGSFVSGLIGSYSIQFLASTALFLVAFLCSMRMSESSKEKLTAPPRLPLSIVRNNLKVYLAFFLRHTGAMGVWAVYPLFLTAIGADKFWIGIVYTVNPIFQFIFMLLLDRHKSAKLVPLGLIFSALTFVLFGVARDYRTFALIQIVLALSWSGLYLGSLKFLLERNVERATSIGIFNSVSGLCGIIGPMLGGFLSLFGFEVLMFAAALMSLLGWLAFKFVPIDTT